MNEKAFSKTILFLIPSVILALFIMIYGLSKLPQGQQPVNLYAIEQQAYERTKAEERGILRAKEEAKIEFQQEHLETARALTLDNIRSYENLYPQHKATLSRLREKMKTAKTPQEYIDVNYDLMQLSKL